MQKEGRQQAFILVELLMAVLIMSFIGGVIYHLMSNGYQLWNQAVRMNTRDDVDFYYEKITQDLRNAFSYASVEFKGESDSMMFFRLNQQAKSSKESGGKYPEPSRIQYSFNPSEQTVDRREESYYAILNPKSHEANAVPLVDKIKNQKYEYYYADKRFGYEWKSYWQDVCFPQAVRISIDYTELGKSRTASKIIALPHGTCSL